MPWSEGQRLGRYTLVRLLGRGGGGEAWEAILHGPRGFTRSVALKFLPDGVSAGPQLDALVHEARIGSLLQHPNVVGTYELSEIEGVVFIALELVRGLSVRSLARLGPLPAGALLDLGIQACAGLHHIHTARVDGVAAGLVHRDVKPGNLLVDTSGLVKVADFGISQRAGDGNHTSGTPGYAPPEQFDGAVDARSDLFALGATLASLMLSEPPFGRSRDGGVEVIERRLRDPAFLERLDARVAGVSPVLARCLQPRREDRHPSAEALSDALSALRSRQPAGPSLRELVAERSPSADGVAVAPASGGLTPVMDAEPTVVLRGNLPAPPDRFFGRAELPAVLEVLAGGARVVTLLGPGGMGKTRLALEVARVVHDRLRQGAWFFDLADASTEDGLLAHLATGLSIELGAAAAPDRVGHAIRALGKTLVVLDNLEQVVEPARRVLRRLVALAPEASFLCTSRVPLRLDGERRVTVGPLPLDEGVALFRARAPRPIRTEELAEVRRVVEALEGMPLAIELSAARAGTFTLSDLRARLRDRLALLAGEDARRPVRHRSVDASLSWSWDLLPEWGRRALGQLAVFEGGFTARAVEAVLDPRDLQRHSALDVLELLVDTSFLRFDPDTRRFGMLAVVQAFASARLDAESRGRADLRHGRVYALLGERAALAVLRGPGGAERFARLAADVDNLHAGARRAIERGDGEVALPTLRALSAVVLRQGPFSRLEVLLRAATALPGLPAEERDALRLALARCHHEMGQAAVARPQVEAVLRDVRARAAGVSGERRTAAVRLELDALLQLASILGSLDEIGVAEVAARAALALAEPLGDPLREADACVRTGAALTGQARFDEARPWFEAAVSTFRRLGSLRDEALVTGELGRCEHFGGRFGPARALYQRSLAVVREVGDRAGEANRLVNLGLLEKDLGHSREALALYRDALRLCVELGDRSNEMWLNGAIGYLHLEQLAPEDARAPLEQAVAVAEELDDPMRCQWESALARYHARRGDRRAAEAHLEVAERIQAGRPSNLRVWVGCARAEVSWRLGLEAVAWAELGKVEAWLASRTTARGTRPHQEIERVRALMAAR